MRPRPILQTRHGIFCALLLGFLGVVTSAHAAKNGNSNGNGNGNANGNSGNSGTDSSGSDTSGGTSETGSNGSNGNGSDGNSSINATGSSGDGTTSGSVTGAGQTGGEDETSAPSEPAVDPLIEPDGHPSDGVILGAPGVGLVFRTVDDLPFNENTNIGRYFRYTFTGIEVQADADGVPGCYPYDGMCWDKPKKSNNGHGNNCDGVDSSNPGKSKQGLDSDPTVDDECKDEGNGNGNGNAGADPVPGWWEMWGRVNEVEARSLTFSTAELHRLSPIMRLYLSEPVVFREETIELSWAGDGNSGDPDGHFYILGSAIKEPPVPVGELQFNQTYYQNGSKPPFSWNVVRE